MPTLRSVRTRAPRPSVSLCAALPVGLRILGGKVARGGLPRLPEREDPTLWMHSLSPFVLMRIATEMNANMAWSAASRSKAARTS